MRLCASKPAVRSIQIPFMRAGMMGVPLQLLNMCRIISGAEKPNKPGAWLHDLLLWCLVSCIAGWGLRRLCCVATDQVV